MEWPTPAIDRERRPDTSAGRVAAAFFEAYAPGPDGSLRAFAEANLTEQASCGTTRSWCLPHRRGTGRSHRFELRGREPLGLISVTTGRVTELRGEEGDGATLLIRFEEPVGGARSFELDEAGKIVHTNVMISRQLGMYEPPGATPIYDRRAESAD